MREKQEIIKEEPDRYHLFSTEGALHAGKKGIHGDIAQKENQKERGKA